LERLSIGFSFGGNSKKIGPTLMAIENANEFISNVIHRPCMTPSKVKYLNYVVSFYYSLLVLQSQPADPRTIRKYLCVVVVVYLLKNSCFNIAMNIKPKEVTWKCGCLFWLFSTF